MCKEGSNRRRRAPPLACLRALTKLAATQRARVRTVSRAASGAHALDRHSRPAGTSARGRTRKDFPFICVQTFICTVVDIMFPGISPTAPLPTSLPHAPHSSGWPRASKLRCLSLAIPLSSKRGVSPRFVVPECTHLGRTRCHSQLGQASGHDRAQASHHGCTSTTSPAFPTTCSIAPQPPASSLRASADFAALARVSSALAGWRR